MSTEMDPSSATDGTESSVVRNFLLFAVPTLLIVGGTLFGVSTWLGGGGVGGENGRADDRRLGRDEVGGESRRAYGVGGESRRADGPRRGGMPPEADDDRIGFHPKVGAYLLETRVAGAAGRRSGIDITEIDNGIYRLTQAYRPPEPFLDTIPEVLAPHLGKIRVRIDISDDGHIIDVTGPDDYFEELEEQEPGSADLIRALLLEEQIDAHFVWQVRSVLVHSREPEQTWTERALFRGFGNRGEWTATLHYSLGTGEMCGAMSPDENCLPVVIRTEESSDGTSLSGTLWVGEDTGMQWSSQLILDRNGTQKEVRTKVSPR